MSVRMSASVDSTAQGRKTWERHPADTARFIVATIACTAAIALTRAEPEAIRQLSVDLVLLFDQLPELVARVLVGSVQVAALVAPLAALLFARRGRWAEIGTATAAGLMAALAARGLNSALDEYVPPQVIDAARQPSWITGSAFPSGAYVAATAAALTVIAPLLTHSWRRVAWWAIGIVSFARVLTAVEAPLNLVATYALGVAVGSAALMIVGAPSRRPSPAQVAAALATAGVDAQVEISPATNAHGAGYVAATASGPLYVKVIGRDQRDADLLARFVRAVRVKGVEDDRPVGPRLSVEREALNTLMAAKAGVSVADVVALGETDDRGAFIALVEVDGTPLTELSEEQLSDHLLRAAFEQLAMLHRARIAHRWASADHFLLRADGSLVLLDFRWAETAAHDEPLAGDLAELLTSLSVRVGVERAVAAAATVYSHDELAASLPLLQPLAVSTTTRRNLRGRKQLLGELRTAVQTTAGVEKYEMMELQRLSLRKVISFVAFLVVANLMLGFVSDFGAIWQELKGADFTKVPLMVVMVVGTYAAGAMSLMGSVNIRLPFIRTTVIMFAQSFLNRFIPANAGGMALRARYLQRSGVDLVVAAASVGLTSGASGIIQVLTAMLFFIWAGSSVEDTSSFSLPSSQTLLVVVVVLLAVIGIVAATAFGRRMIAKLRLEVGALLKELAILAKRPSKMLLLFGGPFISKVLSILMLAQSLRAFGVETNFAQLGAMYITATTVAAAAPTPGGVGAIEAALSAGLIGLGIDPATAVAVVVFFRVLTYWMPVPPCWLALRYVQRHDIV